MKAGRQITVPKGLGLKQNKPGDDGFCYEAVHTHDDTGIMHFADDSANDTRLAPFIEQWRPGVLQGRFLVDGLRPSDLGFRLRRNVDVKVFLHEDPTHRH